MRPHLAADFPRRSADCSEQTQTDIRDTAELGKEKSQSLDGLTDKQIEEAVTTLVKNDSVA